MNVLTLNINNLVQLQHGVAASVQFNNEGGTIGSHGADWQLIDRERRIHPIHCEIRWIESSFCAIDHCGQTFLNDSLLSLARLTPVRLQDGDCLRIGAYRLQVHYQQSQQNRDLSRSSLAELLDPRQRVLDTLTTDIPANAWRIENAEPSAHSTADICEMFGPGVGSDPLAALDGSVQPHPELQHPLQHFITGGRS